MSVYQKIRELRYKKAVEKIVDYAIINLDEGGRIEDWTDAAKRIFGYGVPEVNAAKYGIFFAGGETQKNNWKKLLEQTARYGKISGKYTLVRKDKSTFEANILFNAIADDKRVVGYTLIIGDLSTQKKIAKKMKDFKERKIDKANTVSERKIKIQKAQLDLLIKEFDIVSNSLSHDLRAPLRAIEGYLKLIEEDYANVLDADGKKMIDVVIRNSKKMGSQIENLVAFSRISTREIKREKLNVYEIVKEVVADLKKLNEIKATITIDKLPSIEGDQSLISIAFTHLLSNAIKFSSKTESAVIHISSEIENNDVIYRVKDNGVGFNMEYSHKLFDSFQRLHKEEDFEGTGIGLAIVKLIAVKHNGTIWTEAEENKGACFYLKLPIK
ncbi:MAG: ATP-binding protein [Bacteroidota bacterium]|nr:ATP-binding protein [Bacteroidota bacterium]